MAIITDKIRKDQTCAAVSAFITFWISVASLPYPLEFMPTLSISNTFNRRDSCNGRALSSLEHQTIKKRKIIFPPFIVSHNSKNYLLVDRSVRVRLRIFILVSADKHLFFPYRYRILSKNSLIILYDLIICNSCWLG